MYTVQEGINAQLGQLGVAFNNGTDVFTAPSDMIIVAIQIAETGTSFNALTPDDTSKYMGTTAAAHTAGTPEEGSNGDTFEGALTFLQGFTIYGRWRSASLDAGSAIYYLGAK